MRTVSKPTKQIHVVVGTATHGGKRVKVNVNMRFAVLLLAIVSVSSAAEVGLVAIVCGVELDYAFNVSISNDSLGMAKTLAEVRFSNVTSPIEVVPGRYNVSLSAIGTSWSSSLIEIDIVAGERLYVMLSGRNESFWPVTITTLSIPFHDFVDPRMFYIRYLSLSTQSAFTSVQINQDSQLFSMVPHLSPGYPDFVAFSSTSTSDFFINDDRGATLDAFQLQRPAMSQTTFVLIGRRNSLFPLSTLFLAETQLSCVNIVNSGSPPIFVNISSVPSGKLTQAQAVRVFVPPGEAFVSSATSDGVLKRNASVSVPAAVCVTLLVRSGLSYSVLNASMSVPPLRQTTVRLINALDDGAIISANFDPLISFSNVQPGAAAAIGPIAMTGGNLVLSLSLNGAPAQAIQLPSSLFTTSSVTIVVFNASGGLFASVPDALSLAYTPIRVLNVGGMVTDVVRTFAVLPQGLPPFLLGAPEVQTTTLFSFAPSYLSDCLVLDAADTIYFRGAIATRAGSMVTLVVGGVGHQANVFSNVENFDPSPFAQMGRVYFYNFLDSASSQVSVKVDASWFGLSQIAKFAFESLSLPTGSHSFTFWVNNRQTTMTTVSVVGGSIHSVYIYGSSISPKTISIRSTGFSSLRLLNARAAPVGFSWLGRVQRGVVPPNFVSGPLVVNSPSVRNNTFLLVDSMGVSVSNDKVMHFPDGSDVLGVAAPVGPLFVSLPQRTTPYSVVFVSAQTVSNLLYVEVDGGAVGVINSTNALEMASSSFTSVAFKDNSGQVLLSMPVNVVKGCNYAIVATGSTAVAVQVVRGRCFSSISFINSPSLPTMGFSYGDSIPVKPSTTGTSRLFTETRIEAFEGEFDKYDLICAFDNNGVTAACTIPLALTRGNVYAAAFTPSTFGSPPSSAQLSVFPVAIDSAANFVTFFFSSNVNKNRKISLQVGNASLTLANQESSYVALAPGSYRVLVSDVSTSNIVAAGLLTVGRSDIALPVVIYDLPTGFFFVSSSGTIESIDIPSNSNPGLIAGVVVGVLGSVFIVGALVIYRRRRRFNQMALLSSSM